MNILFFDAKLVLAQEFLFGPPIGIYTTSNIRDSFSFLSSMSDTCLPKIIISQKQKITYVIVEMPSTPQ